MNDETKAAGISRKDFLRLGAKAGAVGMVGGSLAWTAEAQAGPQDAQASWASVTKVDVHNHLVPAAYVSALAAIGITGAGGGPFPAWTPESAIATMNQFGITVGLLSMSSPGVYVAGNDPGGVVARAVSLAQLSNDAAADAVARYPTRFGFFACLPMPLVNESITEAQRAVQLGADGFVMLSNVNNIYVGDPSYEPLMAYLDSIQARVFIHPNSNPLLATLGVAAPPFAVEFPFDTTRAVVNLLANGIPIRYPNIKFILAHAGGVVPYLAGRINYLSQQPPVSTNYPNGLIPELQKFYYDTSLATFPYAQEAMRSLVPSSNILFGSDTPFAPNDIVAQEITQLESTSVLKVSQRKNVGYRNALALFPSLSGKLGLRA